MSVHEVSPMVLAFWGIFAFCEAPAAWGFRSNWLRRFYGGCVFGAMSSQIFNLFPSLSAASSFQLFCFVGLVLGCLAGARLLSFSANSTSDKTFFKENKIV